ncbi:MAG: TetR/AcrR family transcriptional regulator [Nocardioides sp.]
MTSRPTREPLSRPVVVAAAVALADAEGLDAVSMRRLAERLGVVPMALYKHVADKDDLVDAMVDQLIAELDPPPPPSGRDGWLAAVRGTIRSARAAVLRHPWARRAIETRTRRTPAVLGHMETLTQLFLAGGLSPDLTHHAMHLLGNRIWGFSPELFNAPVGPTSARSRRTPPPDPAHYPGILAIAADATARRPDATGCDEDFEFDFALDVILTGVARLHAQGWDSTR